MRLTDANAAPGDPGRVQVSIEAASFTAKLPFIYANGPTASVRVAKVDAEGHFETFGSTYETATFQENEARELPVAAMTGPAPAAGKKKRKYKARKPQAAPQPLPVGIINSEPATTVEEPGVAAVGD